MSTQIERERHQWNSGYAACAKQVLGQLELMTSLVRLKYGNLDPKIYNEILKAESLIADLKLEYKIQP